MNDQVKVMIFFDTGDILRLTNERILIPEKHYVLQEEILDNHKCFKEKEK